MNDLISRKALIDSIKETFCKDCNNYHEVRCRACEWDDAMGMVEDAPAVNPVPVKIGDTAWVICNHKGNKKPKQGVVSEMYYTDDMSLCIVVKFVRRGTWGKEVFGTAEEAWEAIGGKDNV